MRTVDLEWNGHGDNLDASAFGIRVFYRVFGQPGGWTLRTMGDQQYVDTPGYATQVAAKSAAQVDFVRRVKASIVGDEITLLKAVIADLEAAAEVADQRYIDHFYGNDQHA